MTTATKTAMSGIIQKMEKKGLTLGEKWASGNTRNLMRGDNVIGHITFTYYGVLIYPNNSDKVYTSLRCADQWR